jgi:hypothetical protein
VDERARLAARAVDRERVAHGALHEEAVEHRAVVAVVVEAVDEALVQPGLGGLRAPHDALVEVRDADLVVLVVEREQELVERLRGVVDAAGAGGEEDLLLHLAAVVGLHAHGQIALGDLDPRGAVAVHAHGAEVDDVRVQLRLDERGQQVVRRVDVVVDRVALVARGLHGVRRGALLGEVHHRVGLEVLEHLQERVVVLRDVELVERDVAPGDLSPGVQADRHGLDRRERLGAELHVGGAPREVVDDRHFMAARRQVEGRRPSAEPVTAQNQDA